LNKLSKIENPMTPKTEGITPVMIGLALPNEPLLMPKGSTCKKITSRKYNEKFNSITIWSYAQKKHQNHP
jgi:hypothetical protein